MKPSLWIGVVCCIFLHASLLQAQTRYPSRPVTLIVPFAAGGSGDATMRYIADQLQKSRGVSMVVENRPGGGATIGLSAVARSAPDGYTVGLISTSPVTVTPHFQKVPYDPLKDFTFLTQYTVSPAPVYVQAESRFKTIEEMIEFGRANPGKLRWATAAPRGTNHIAMEIALRQQKVSGTFVAFGGGAEPLIALLGGNLEFVVGTDFGPSLRNKQVRLLAESGPKKIVGHPEVRTFAELGYPLILPIFLGIGGPAGLSPEVVKFWEDGIRELVGTPGFNEMLGRFFSPPDFLDSKAFTQRIRDAHAGTGKAVR
ncbi:MAG: tripartite tricarboxylate transporter substrate binding protein, partial [Burkholderiales bacterium]